MLALYCYGEDGSGAPFFKRKFRNAEKHLSLALEMGCGYRGVGWAIFRGKIVGALSRANDFRYPIGYGKQISPRKSGPSPESDNFTETTYH